MLIKSSYLVIQSFNKNSPKRTPNEAYKRVLNHSKLDVFKPTTFMGDKTNPSNQGGSSPRRKTLESRKVIRTQHYLQNSTPLFGTVIEA